MVMKPLGGRKGGGTARREIMTESFDMTLNNYIQGSVSLSPLNDYS